MNEFNNRIDAQREVVRLVNRKTGQREELFGLSSKAIDRWLTVNMIDPQCRLAELVKSAAAEMFFLANKSQEQVTDEYRLRAVRVAALTREIATESER
jgi:hypothetical protein